MSRRLVIQALGAYSPADPGAGVGVSDTSHTGHVGHVPPLQVSAPVFPTPKHFAIRNEIIPSSPGPGPVINQSILPRVNEFKVCSESDILTSHGEREPGLSVTTSPSQSSHSSPTQPTHSHNIPHTHTLPPLAPGNRPASPDLGETSEVRKPEGEVRAAQEPSEQAGV